MIYRLGSQLQETNLEAVLQSGASAVCVVSERECQRTMDALDIHVELDIVLHEICFCKVESQKEENPVTPCAAQSRPDCAARFLRRQDALQRGTKTPAARSGNFVTVPKNMNGL
ncbi:MAG: hypothetical protein LUG58_06180 [Clostridiales bacterium]|nr:hypothetical protein [Clostridiales bacterium]